VLYTLIGYGHDSEATALKLDPPDDFFRLRMVSGLHSSHHDSNAPLRAVYGQQASVDDRFSSTCSDGVML
jgi:hypothetical protein